MADTQNPVEPPSVDTARQEADERAAFDREASAARSASVGMPVDDEEATAMLDSDLAPIDSDTGDGK